MDQISFNHKPSIIGLDEVSRFSVCIPLIKTQHGYEVLFEVRAMHIDKQPGDVCLPGGFVEKDELPFQAAIRESEEELLIDKEQIHMIGLCDLLFNSRLCIYPYAAILTDYTGTFSDAEVDHTFTVPLAFFLETEPAKYVTKGKVIPPEDFPYEKIYGGRDYRWRSRRESVYFYEFGDHVIWGITAKIMRSFAKICRAESVFPCDD